MSGSKFYWKKVEKDCYLLMSSAKLNPRQLGIIAPSEKSKFCAYINMYGQTNEFKDLKTSKKWIEEEVIKNEDIINKIVKDVILTLEESHNTLDDKIIRDTLKYALEIFQRF